MSTPPRSLLFSELYAASQGARCSGEEECHWCGAPCTREWLHDDVPSISYARSKSTARRPGCHFICVGCWLFRRKRLTVFFLDNTFKDGQCPLDHSWLVTPDRAAGVHYECLHFLYPVLLKPPLRFSLSLLDGGRPPQNLNQLCVVNDNPEVHAGTPLSFTVNNIPHSYTVYELEEGIRGGEDGRMPGVRALLRLLGPAPSDFVGDLKPREAEAKKAKGRPESKQQEAEDLKRLRRTVRGPEESEAA